MRHRGPLRNHHLMDKAGKGRGLMNWVHGDTYSSSSSLSSLGSATSSSSSCFLLREDMAGAGTGGAGLLEMELPEGVLTGKEDNSDGCPVGEGEERRERKVGGKGEAGGEGRGGGEKREKGGGGGGGGGGRGSGRRETLVVAARERLLRKGGGWDQR